MGPGLALNREAMTTPVLRLGRLLLLAGAMTLPAIAQAPQPLNGPWNNDLVLARSKDGLRFDAPETWLEAGGVPHVVRDARGKLIAAFQWFPNSPAESFDRIAIRTSSDQGRTWTEPKTIVVRGLPSGFNRPCDPTLAVLEDGRLRMYVTVDPGDGQGAGCYSLISRDGVTFDFEPGARFRDPGKNVLDPSVARLDGAWHYYAGIQDVSGRGYHAVSTDGLNFRRVADVSLPVPGSWLGCAVATSEGLRFYGTGGRGGWCAVSRDGAEWTLREDFGGVAGADPGVVRTGDGYLLIATGPPRPREDTGETRLSATPTSVYVLRGNTLYRFDARTLQLQGSGKRE